MEKKKIVFLYTELATYFLACIDKLLKHPNIEVFIIRYAVNKEAPFQFSFSENIKIYNRNDFVSVGEMQKIISEINPSIIYCSGWIDKSYLTICKQYKNKIPVIVGFDNQWKGSLKQQLARLISPFKILNHFSHCWVPGSLQEQYALKLGFKKQNILTNFYSCDFELFHHQYFINKAEKEKYFPKKFIYVGRYYEFKGIKKMWEAFVELQNETPNDWQLWCLGTGDVEPVMHEKIKHFGFVQPNDLPNYIKQTGVFVLPSFFEPWGVVVHEFAAAGFPLIVSNEVGARVAFVENEKNGYIYHSENKEQLKQAMKNIMNKSTKDLIAMATLSVEKAKQITPEKWAKTLIDLLK